MPTRSDFLKASCLSIAGFIIPPFLIKKAGNVDPIHPDLVKDFVGKSHRDMDTVVQLYQEHPTLLNAAWDWGGGDYETALGAASHVGYLELVHFLLQNGAQFNFLTLCLLGHLEEVKKLLELYPNLLQMKGPHGFTPLHHAIRGGEKAQEVRYYLESLGARETKLDLGFGK